MKHLAFLFAGFLCIATACTKSDRQDDQNQLESQKMADFLANTYGIKHEEIEETEDAFIVEGDITFPKADFWDNYDRTTANEVFYQPTDDVAERKHYRATYVVTTTDNIIVNIRPGVPASWQQAIENAVDAWNNLYGGLYFEVQYSNSNSDLYGVVNVSMNSSLPSKVFARGGVPSSYGNPGKTLHINPLFNNMALSPKTKVMAHELGHTIGFMHTDSGEGTLITDVSSPCRTQTNPQSLMRSGQKSTDLFTGFTGCDVEAYDALYWW